MRNRWRYSDSRCRYKGTRCDGNHPVFAQSLVELCPELLRNFPSAERSRTRRCRGRPDPPSSIGRSDRSGGYSNASAGRLGSGRFVPSRLPVGVHRGGTPSKASSHLALLNPPRLNVTASCSIEMSSQPSYDSPSRSRCIVGSFSVVTNATRVSEPITTPFEFQYQRYRRRRQIRPNVVRRSTAGHEYRPLDDFAERLNGPHHEQWHRRQRFDRPPACVGGHICHSFNCGGDLKVIVNR